MRYFSLAILIGLAACGGGPRVPESAVAGSGIIGSLREGNSVSIVYQKSSTSDQMLYAEASSACSAVGRKPGARTDAPLSSSGNIPGVDGKVIFQCV